MFYTKGKYGIDFTTSEECREWINKLRELILEEAWKSIKFWQGPLQEGYMLGYVEHRAPCPLCGEVADSWYYVEQEGYKLNDGLLMHLDGIGNTSECKIYKHLIDEVETKERELWNLEQEIEEDKLNERRMNETIYKIGPYSEGVLYDERTLGMFDGTKNLSDKNILETVEKRLFSMNFKKIIKSNSVSYVIDNEKYLIYADPRPFKKIDFRIYKKPIPKKGNTFSEDFYILDKWKDLNKILNNRISKFFNKN